MTKAISSSSQSNQECENEKLIAIANRSHVNIRRTFSDSHIVFGWLQLDGWIILI